MKSLACGKNRLREGVEKMVLTCVEFFFFPPIFVFKDPFLIGSAASFGLLERAIYIAPQLCYVKEAKPRNSIVTFPDLMIGMK